MMKTNKIILIGLFVTLTLQAWPQGSETAKPLQRQLGLGIGIQQRQLLDEQKSALVYSSREYTAGLFYRRISDRSVFSAELDFSTGSFFAKHFRDRKLYSTGYEIDGSVTADSLPVLSGILAGIFQVSYLRILGRGENTAWYAGAALKDLLIYPENNIGILNSVGLYLTAQVARDINSKNRMSANLSIPLVAVNTRLPWHNTATSPVESETATFFKRDSRLVTVNNFQSAQCNVNYTFRLASRWNLGAEYAFVWLRVPYYQPMKSFINSIQLQTSYRF
jgi:hypothetical protein